MSPKERAREIVELFWTEVEDNEYVSRKMSYKQAKQCALIAVDEILKNFGTLTEGKQHYAAYSTIQFYEKVKVEIENIGGEK